MAILLAALSEEPEFLVLWGFHKITSPKKIQKDL